VSPRFRMILTLLIVGIFSGGSLSFVYQATKDKIQENLKKEIESSLFRLLPCDSYTRVNWKGKPVFICKNKEGKILGYAIIGEGEGFQGKITLMLAVDEELKTIKGIDVLQSQETPGLGAKIDEKEFKSQFRGRKIGERKLEVVKRKSTSEEEIEAITGATISSRAVVNLVNELIQDLREFLRENK